MLCSISKLEEPGPEQKWSNATEFPGYSDFPKFLRGTNKISEWNSGKCLFQFAPTPGISGIFGRMAPTGNEALGTKLDREQRNQTLKFLLLIFLRTSKAIFVLIMYMSKNTYFRLMWTLEITSYLATEPNRFFQVMGSWFLTIIFRESEPFCYKQHPLSFNLLLQFRYRIRSRLCWWNQIFVLPNKLVVPFRKLVTWNTVLVTAAQLFGTAYPVTLDCHLL